MSTQQSFYPLLSNAALYERMFRSKPYTKCISCLTDDKLKCKKCMQLIIKDITEKDNQRKNFRIKEVGSINCISPKLAKLNKQQLRLKTDYRNSSNKSNKENEQKVMITSKYNWWMAQRVKKRHLDITLKSLWPKKVRSKNGDFQNFGVKPPKFERWEKKLLDQLLLKNQA